MVKAEEVKAWLKRSKFVHLVGDASKISYAAYTPSHELSGLMDMPLHAAEIALMAANQLSSVFREVKIVRVRG